MNLDIDAAVERALLVGRLAWLAFNVCVGTLIWQLLGGWWLVSIPVIASLTYQLTIALTAKYLVAVLIVDELENGNEDGANEAFRQLAEGLKDGTITPGSEHAEELVGMAGVEAAIVTKMSDEKIGRYLDQDMHEWIEMLDPITKNVQRYTFNSVAEKDRDGEFVSVHLPGMVAAHFNNCVYTRPST